MHRPQPPPTSPEPPAPHLALPTPGPRLPRRRSLDTLSIKPSSPVSSWANVSVGVQFPSEWRPVLEPPVNGVVHAREKKRDQTLFYLGFFFYSFFETPFSTFYSDSCDLTHHRASRAAVPLMREKTNSCAEPVEIGAAVLLRCFIGSITTPTVHLSHPWHPTSPNSFLVLNVPLTCSGLRSAPKTNHLKRMRRPPQLVYGYQCMGKIDMKAAEWQRQ